MKYKLSILLLLISFYSCTQKLVSRREAIEKARKEIAQEFEAFNERLLTMDLDSNIQLLEKAATDPYKKYLAGGLLYSLDPEKSFQLHREAYESNPKEQNFILEYAIELHRREKYAEAIPLYEAYQKADPGDFRITVWLADCFINTGDAKKSMEHWAKSNFHKNKTSIDFAIHIIYGRSDQMKQRNEDRKAIAAGNTARVYDLIYRDLNWELDWWNTNIQKILLEADLEFIEKKIGADQYKTLKAYVNIKRLASSRLKASIESSLKENKLILGNNTFPENGKVASDLLEICIDNYLIDGKTFYETRGNEILGLSKKSHDVDFLNMYAHLQALSKQKVDPETDLLGWKEYKDPRFASSYFVGKANNLKLKDAELQQAIEMFPNASLLFAIQMQCAKNENVSLKPYLITLIQKEFKSLGSDPSHYSYALNSFFKMLSEAN